MSAAPRPSIEAVGAICAATMGITVAEMVAQDRTRKVSGRRYVVAAMMRRWTDASMPAIAAALGMRSHHSVGYGCCQVRERLAHQDPVTTAAFTRCDREIQTTYRAAKPKAVWSTGFTIDVEDRRRRSREHHARRRAALAAKAAG